MTVMLDDSRDGRQVNAICLEGGDGCGKTTVMRELVPRLRDMGYDALPLREPGGNEICESIRDVLLADSSDGMYPITEAMLYAASRYQLMNDLIRPAMCDGKLVVLDRFVYSSFVYQGYVAAEANRLDAEASARLVGDVMRINDMATGGWRPTLTFFLDLPPERAIERMTKGRDSADTNRFDTRGLEYHRMIREAYLRLDRFDEYRVVDADRDVGSIVTDIIGEIRKYCEQGRK